MQLTQLAAGTYKIEKEACRGTPLTDIVVWQAVQWKTANLGSATHEHSSQQVQPSSVQTSKNRYYACSHALPPPDRNNLL